VNRKQVWQPLASFVQNGVLVDIGLQQDDSQRFWLAGRFAPKQGNLHLYSKDLPREGIMGIGCPTRLEIVSQGNIRPAGPLQADQPVISLRVEILNQSYPVYPDGPVSLRLPVTLAATITPSPTELSVTYMACSAGACLPPVVDKRIWVRIQGQPSDRNRE
jgi:hypothetical protein